MAEAGDRSTAAEPSGHNLAASHESWARLAPDYERARLQEDSLDRLLEWPAERSLIGEVAGATVLDVGCGNGQKAAELIRLARPAWSGSTSPASSSSRFLADFT